MTRTRLRVGFVALLVFVATATASVGTVAAASGNAHVTVTNVSVTPDDPGQGEGVTAHVTVSNGAGSNATAHVVSVWVRKAGSATDRGRVDNAGAVEPGATVDVPVTFSAGSSGQTHFVVYVDTKSGGEYTTHEYPFYLDVRSSSAVQLATDTTRAVTGQSTTVNVTVSNGEGSAINGLTLNANGNDARVNGNRRVAASVASGKEKTFGYDVTFDSAGDHTLTAKLQYTTASGDTRTVTRTFDVRVASPNVDASLAVHPRGTSGNGTALGVTLGDYGNAAFRDVTLRAVENGRTVARTHADDVPANASRTTDLDASDLTAGNVTVVADYTAGGVEHTTSRTLSFTPANQGVQLTGVSTSGAGVVTIDGDAANVGLSSASSVLLTVQSANGVTPAGSSTQYFVGSVGASDFATFELTASVSGTADAVPVLVQYTQNGERHSIVQQVSVSAAGAAASGSSGSSGSGRSRGSGSPSSGGFSRQGGPGGSSGSGGLFGSLGQLNWGLLVGAVVVVLAVFGGLYYVWNRE